MTWGAGPWADKPWGAQDASAGASLDLAASALAITGAADVTGDIGIGTGFDLSASPISVTGVLSAAGDLAASTGSGATAAEIWSYTLSSGLTAEATLVAIHTMLSELHLIHGLTAGSPLSVTVASRAAGAVSQAVAEAAGTVTVTRQ